MTTNNYIARLKAQLDQAIVQREHWKQLAEKRNSIVVTEVCPESRSVEEYIIDADSVRSAWRLIRGYREKIEALRLQNAMFVTAAANIDREREEGEAVEVFTTWHPDSRSYEEQDVKLDTKGSRKALGAMNAKLRAKVGRLERELATVKKSLTVEPVAYAAFAENGNIRMWCRSAIGMCELFDAHGNKAVPLYTHPADQVADGVVVARDLLQDLRDLAFDQVEHHRAAMGAYKQTRQSAMDSVLAQADALLEMKP